jgi:flagella basal body P-ring formation protein FlgA
LILSLKAKLVKRVVIATKLIPPDKPISDADIGMEERDIISILTSRCSGWLRTSALVEKADVYGKRAKKQIAPGEILTSEIVEIPPLISRGDKVTIIIELPHLKVTALGRAKEDGYEGQSIRVENASSQKIITAKVINDKLVRVEL